MCTLKYPPGDWRMCLALVVNMALSKQAWQQQAGVAASRLPVPGRAETGACTMIAEDHEGGLSNDSGSTGRLAPICGAGVSYRRSAPSEGSSVVSHCIL
jgi:hypothetical protein